MQHNILLSTSLGIHLIGRELQGVLVSKPIRYTFLLTESQKSTSITAIVAELNLKRQDRLGGRPIKDVDSGLVVILFSFVSKSKANY